MSEAAITGHEEYVAAVRRLVEVARELTELRGRIEQYEALRPNESRWDAAHEG